MKRSGWIGALAAVVACALLAGCAMGSSGRSGTFDVVKDGYE